MDELLGAFKHSLEASIKEGSTGEDDLNTLNLVQMVDDLIMQNKAVSKYGRAMSALIATASLMMKSCNFDIASVDLDLPEGVKTNLEKALPIFLDAVQIDGYEDRKKRKAFVLGNTGNIILHLNTCILDYRA